MARKRWFLVTYDVRDPKRLRRCAKQLKGYGSRIQYSVFRCRLTEREVEQMRWELNKLLKEEDDVLIVGLCDGCARRVRVRSPRVDWLSNDVEFEIV